MEHNFHSANPYIIPLPTGTIKLRMPPAPAHRLFILLCMVTQYYIEYDDADLQPTASYSIIVLEPRQTLTVVLVRS